MIRSINKLSIAAKSLVNRADIQMVPDVICTLPKTLLPRAAGGFFAMYVIDAQQSLVLAGAGICH